MYKSRVPLLGLVVLLLGTATAGGVPPELRAAAVLAEADHEGIIAFEVTWETQASGGPFHRYFRYRNAYVYDGERFVDARALQRNDNGKIAGQAELDVQTRKLVDEHRREPSAGFAVPFDDRHFSEYRYTIVPCTSGCSQSDVAIAFAAKNRDSLHGDGRMVLDRDAHVKRLEYVSQSAPSFRGAKLQEAHVTIERGPVLPGYWGTILMHSRLVGHYGFITGEALQTARYDHYERFQSISAALAALQRP
ncbi:MAG: hypothetical protein DLM50_08745 [Candidatus Meridianibacter frigidus]|nr:MAG: hypothetical protein DLM50_08745 [Candidatus Eremiobacteraeota bacterium]